MMAREGEAPARRVIEASLPADTQSMATNPRYPQVAKLVLLSDDFGARLSEESSRIHALKDQLDGLWVSAGDDERGQVIWQYHARPRRFQPERSA
jgi:hypothetical protein